MKKQDKKTEKIEDKKLQKYYFPLIFLVALFFLSVPIARFFSSDSMPGSEPYYTLRISELLKEKITSYDDLSFSGRTYYLNLNHLMLSRFNNSLFFVMFLPLIFGLVSAFLFYKILEKLKINDEQNLIISLILVSSPGFIYTFTVYNLYFIPITLSLLAFYFVLKEKLIIPSVCLALLPLFNIALAPIALFLIFVYYLRHEKKGFILLSILVPVISLVYYLLVFYPALFPQILSLQKQPFLQKIAENLPDL